MSLVASIIFGFAGLLLVALLIGAAFTAALAAVTLPFMAVVKALEGLDAGLDAARAGRLPGWVFWLGYGTVLAVLAAAVVTA